MLCWSKWYIRLTFSFQNINTVCFTPLLRSAQYPVFLIPLHYNPLILLRRDHKSQRRSLRNRLCLCITCYISIINKGICCHYVCIKPVTVPRTLNETLTNISFDALKGHFMSLICIETISLSVLRHIHHGRHRKYGSSK